jgi:hypothetical protein
MVKNPFREKRCFEGDLLMYRRACGMRIEKDTRSASRDQTAHRNGASVFRAFRQTEVQPEFVLVRMFQRERRGQGKD